MEREKRAAALPKPDKFAALKLARQGAQRSKQWKDDQGDDLYDEVDEDAYKSIVRGRLQRDDFIVDDDGGGYADNGMDVFDEEEQYAIEDNSDDDRRNKKKKSAKPSRLVKEKSTALKKSSSAKESSSSAYRKPVPIEKEDDFMSSLLSGMAAKPAAPSKPRQTRPAPRKRKSSPPMGSSSDGESSHLVPPPSSIRNKNGKTRPAPLGPDFSDDFSGSPLRAPKRMKVDAEDGVVVREVSKLKVEDPDDFQMDEFSAADFAAMDDVEIELDMKPSVEKTEPATPAKLKNETPDWLSLHSTLLAAPAEPEEALASTSGSPSTGTTVNALEPDGSLHMYWIDFAEFFGKVYLIGKVLDKGPDGKGKKYVSCCLTIEGIERNLFVVPRDRVYEDGHYTDEVPSREDVWDDFNRMRREVKIQSVSHKWVKRKYAFGMEGVPEGESDFMKVVYEFDEPQMPIGLSSPNIAHIFGAATSPFELFVLKRKIMGPCWLRIQNPEPNKTSLVSWCKAEFTIKDPKLCNPFADTDHSAPRDTPPLTIMSLAVRTVVNHELNKREIVTASLRIWENSKIDDVTPPEKQPSSSHTFVRPIGKYPPGFESKARSQKSSKIIPAPNERTLLNLVLGMMLRYDPDAVVGHDLINNHLEILLQRLKEHSTESWTRIGRLRRSGKMNLGRQGTNSRLLNGRIICDLTSDAAKGMISGTSWSLTEMCQNQLKVTREEIETEDVPDYLDSTVSGPEQMLRFVQHCEMDTFFQMALAAKVQILPLTRQLTNLAGNSWGKTLTGGRSERNEYILLHEFHRLKYVVPDKYWGKNRDASATAKAEAEELDPETGGVSGKVGKGKSKEKYKGGLVFEPKRGLWDKYILVMDFNSLYPSIIQEYNIDFTTVERVDDEDEIPEVPDSSVGQGVLPRLIAGLVNRRRNVKKLMKDRSATKTQLSQWNISQQALKLTANSMYGCLGFSGSRFYARPLAALTTHKGREILTHTRELAESMNLDVVYGDTDSVFVNSNVTDLAEAMKTANQFKKLVNERYKLLEIDLDDVFARLLLLQKKKYAAMVVKDGGTTEMEVKGLDMKRREFSELSKNVSAYVLRQILSGEATELAVEAIHEYLRTVGEEMRAGKTPFDDFIIHKRLSKDPEKYPDAKSQPHVQVALRLKSKGGHASSGDVIPYIFCLGPNGESSKSGQADRAFHPDEIRKSKGKDGELKVDVEYYLATQVLPPVTRLCEPMQEVTDRARLAECLGLNPDQYAVATSGADKERQLGVLDTQVPDSERFFGCQPFLIRCPKCETISPFTRLHDDSSTHILTSSGPICPSCQAPINPFSIDLQLTRHIQHHISKYYEAWMVCNDPTCEERTRRMSVVPRKCLRRGCLGSVDFEYTNAMLYTQLLYFASLFDEQRVLTASESASKRTDILSNLHVNLEILHQLNATVTRHLERCGRRQVDLVKLFASMGFV